MSEAKRKLVFSKSTASGYARMTVGGEAGNFNRSCVANHFRILHQRHIVLSNSRHEILLPQHRQWRAAGPRHQRRGVRDWWHLRLPIQLLVGCSADWLGRVYAV